MWNTTARMSDGARYQTCVQIDSQSIGAHIDHGVSSMSPDNKIEKTGIGVGMIYFHDLKIKAYAFGETPCRQMLFQIRLGSGDPLCRYQ